MKISVYSCNNKFLLGECKRNVKCCGEVCYGQCETCEYWQFHNKTVDSEDDVPKEYRN